MLSPDLKFYIEFQIIDKHKTQVQNFLLQTTLANMILKISNPIGWIGYSITPVLQFSTSRTQMRGHQRAPD